MKRVRQVAEQLPRSPANQDNVAPSSGLPSRFLQSVHVLLMKRMQAEAIGHAQGLFVQAFQVGVRNVFHGGGLVEEFPIEKLPSQDLCETPSDLAAAGTIFPRDGDDVHDGRSSEGRNKKAPQERCSPGGAISTQCHAPPKGEPSR